MKKALEYFELDKENFESYLDGATVTDSQWEQIADEIDGRVANFVDELIGIIVVDFQEGAYDD